MRTRPSSLHYFWQWANVAVWCQHVCLQETYSCCEPQPAKNINQLATSTNQTKAYVALCSAGIMDQAARVMNRAIDALKRENLNVLKPGEPDYERSVITTNRLYRFSRPNCVIHPKSILDVQKVVNEAVSQNIAITVKNGGHSYAGFSTASQGILLDLKELNKGKIDIESKIVTLEGGMVWGQVYMLLINGKHDGYIINGGRCPSVGASGFMLGGGLGPFTRSFGMGSDTLKEATIVTANGKRVTVKDTDDPSSPKGSSSGPSAVQEVPTLVFSSR
ncbi:hypothetical protein TrVFT333_010505 [Trichoderma virens FT-333]|nr:hypothetical protein TrVFT333_010505 [Trichoderma virens FT-333]